METIVIKHPLRDIVYQTQEAAFHSPIEINALEAYLKAHDEAWRMKRLFEHEKGEVLLAHIELNKRNQTREGLEHIREHYFREIDFSDPTALAALEIRFQVEMRDFYNEVRQQKYNLVKFYDTVGPLEQAYKEIIDTYLRGKKSLDPAKFDVLDEVFEFQADMDVDVRTLDKDLQSFLQTLTDIYTLLDEYVGQFNDFYTAYNEALQKAVDIVKSTDVFNKVWE